MEDALSAVTSLPDDDVITDDPVAVEPSPSGSEVLEEYVALPEYDAIDGDPDGS